MKMCPKHLLFSIFKICVSASILTILAQAHFDQTGFISIDCGSEKPSYTDDKTGISYLSDSTFTESGENNDVLASFKSKTDEQQLWNLRSFPEGARNCYGLEPKSGVGTRYLIRARFLYGNYDNNDQTPKFDLHIGVDFWDTVEFLNSSEIISKEIIHVPWSKRVDVCLINTNSGTPFLSVLDLRPIDIKFYLNPSGTSLLLHNRYDFGSQTNKPTRYKDDKYDRFWSPFFTSHWTPLTNTSLTEEDYTLNGFAIPFTVMKTGYSLNDVLNMGIVWDSLNKTTRYFFYIHYMETMKLQQNQIRQFDIYLNKQLWLKQVNPRYGYASTIYSDRGSLPDDDGKILFWFNNTSNATLPPLINALEVYRMQENSGGETFQKDVDAILTIKTEYGLKIQNWVGDPCLPQDYVWDGLNCTYKRFNQPRITSLDLSSRGLTGEISFSISNLTMLQYLDLSNNSLTGTVPEFLAELEDLRVLNLKGNILQAPLPTTLINRSKNGLYLSLDQYLIPCESCGPPGNKIKVVPLVASLGSLVLMALILGFIFWLFKRKRQKGVILNVESTPKEPEEEDPTYGSKRQQFTYSEIQRITGNFRKVLGEGGFGKVYHGYLNGNEVAVKMLSSASIQGHKQFHTELKLLLRVHHKNLTTLVGYCNEESNIGLIYEYMAEGNLQSHISGNSNIVLSWEARLRIAIDAAQGLEYLHNGCKPPIIHRDVKSTNILLGKKFQAKLGDFGLSKVFPLEGVTQTTTSGIASGIAGTPGYLDPEYYITNWLNEKSDVYSFGVVMLELITSRPVLGKTRENNHIIQWVSSMLAKGDVKTIIDPRLGGDYDINTVWKAIEISMACVSKTSSTRPSMSQVTTDLKDCLVTELVRTNSHTTGLSRESSVEMTSSLMISEFGPTAR